MHYYLWQRLTENGLDELAVGRNVLTTLSVLSAHLCLIYISEILYHNLLTSHEADFRHGTAARKSYNTKIVKTSKGRDH